MEKKCNNLPEIEVKVLSKSEETLAIGKLERKSGVKP